MRSLLLTLFLIPLSIMVTMPFAPVGALAAEVRNESLRQEGNRFVFEFDLDSSVPVDVTVNVTYREKEYPGKDLHLEGDVVKVSPGKGKRVFWNVLRDLPRGLSGEFEYEIVVTGGSTFKDPVTGMEFVFVKGGCYQMGDTFGDGSADEKPVHEVCLSDFYVGKYEVTVGQFREFVRKTSYRTDAEEGEGCFGWTKSMSEMKKKFNWKNLGFPQDDLHPVACMSHNDSVKFVEWLSRESGRKYRLPTEAEWEYAARSGGKEYKYSWGNSSPSGNIADESLKRRFSDWPVWSGYDDGFVFTAPVGSFRPNELGLFDMTGNVWEWTADGYADSYYKNSPRDNPQGASSGKARVLRGGSFSDGRGSIRASFRNRLYPHLQDDHCGFRVVSSP